MSAAPAAPASSADDATLGRLYARTKALALSIGAALALERTPAGALTETELHLAECERAAATRPGELHPHFEACRDAAADLVGLAREAEAGPRPSPQSLAALRGSHRRLRRLVWEVFDCEYVPCAAHQKGACNG